MRKTKNKSSSLFVGEIKSGVQGKEEDSLFLFPFSLITAGGENFWPLRNFFDSIDVDISFSAL